MSAANSAPAISPAIYYARAAVGERIREYCGLLPGMRSRCVFLAALNERIDRPNWEEAPFFPPGALDRILREGSDVSRSLWDADGLLFHVDIDYWNPDRLGEPFTHPIETFFKLEPVRAAALGAFRDFGLQPYDLVTGEGYHFAGRVSESDPAYGRLAALAPETPSWFASQGTRVPAWIADTIDERHARAHVGLGMVQERLAQIILRRAARASEIPAVLNATVVGTGLNGRECISLDLSHLAYPLGVRHVRTAFSTYQKPRFLPGVYGEEVARRAPVLATIPRGEAPLLDVLKIRRDLGQAASLAEQVGAVIPSVAGGIMRLVDDYLGSTLFRFHRAYYAEAVDPAERGVERDPFDKASLPPCIASCLARPNDLLLRPEYLQDLTRLLLSRGVRPRRIARLVQSVYEADFEWGARWVRMHPGWRAEIYVRTFAGLIATGLDQMIDFNCVSTKEKGMCPGGACGHELLDDRAVLLARGGS
jgi:hypothetical protein